MPEKDEPTTIVEPKLDSELAIPDSDAPERQMAMYERMLGVRRSLGPMTDAEIQSSYRLAQALAASSLFKDVRTAEQAFAKLIIGRDLGLSPAQSLQLYAMEGTIEVPYPMLATFVRSRPGYDFSIEWREDREGGAEWVTVEEGGREVTGCRVTFTVKAPMSPPKVRGVSVWTIEDSERAGLTANRGTKTSNHVLYPRNMYLARAMSNGVKAYVPEVLAGLQVYAEGELPRTEALGAGDGSGDGPGWSMDVALAAECERVIRRAEKLGHAGLSNRESVQLQLHGQTDGAVRVWVREATQELDALAKIKAPLVEPEASDPDPDSREPTSDSAPSNAE